jgi:hypothetical protein
VKENAAAREGPSPFQRHAGGRPWRAPALKDFLRQLAWRLGVGPVYAVLPLDENRRADIIARHAAEDRMFCLWTYPGIGLRAMEESGFITMTTVFEIPGYGFECILFQDGALERFGEIPEIRLLSIPGRALAAAPPRENDRLHRRLRRDTRHRTASLPRLRRFRSLA